MKKLAAVLFSLTVAVVFTVTAYSQGDPEAGKRLASRCTCHEREGNRLDGMEAETIVERFMQYKTGEKSHVIMNRIAKKYSEEKVQDIAAYYANRNE
jgi:cytochrome c553